MSKMWIGEFSLCEFLSLLENELFKELLQRKQHRKQRRISKFRKRTRSIYPNRHSKQGWGFTKKRVDKYAERRLREY